MQPVQQWPLGACRGDAVMEAICLDAPRIWTEFGHGAPEVEVAVVETFETVAMGQILTQHPWLQHLNIPMFWHSQQDDPRAQPRPDLLKVPDPLRQRVPSLARDCAQSVALGFREADELPAFCKELDAEQASFALTYLDWRSVSQHELKMIGLISGQSAGTLRRTGLAPLGAVSLHYIGTTPSPRGLARLKRTLDQRPAARVVNFSNEGPPSEMLDLQFARIYRSALALNAGQTDVSGQDPTDRLFVASSANTTGVLRENAIYPRPNKLLPPEAIIERGIERPVENVHRPAIAYALPAPDVPVLIVGGVTSTGKLAARTRLETMIHLYAPSGIAPGSVERSRADTASLQLAAIEAIQRCGSVPPKIANEAVPTLDWGPTDDIRSARYIERDALGWQAAPAHALFEPVGCDVNDALQDGVFFGRIIGNSVATALVSATAAQMFALDPQLSAAEARDILIRTARENRVNGLPVLDATGALQEVRKRLVARMAPTWARGFGTPVLTSIRSRSIAPGAFGQRAWRHIREDPPLEIRFDAIRALRPGLCQLNRLSLHTQTRIIGARHLRVAAPPDLIERRTIACPGSL